MVISWSTENIKILIDKKGEEKKKGNLIIFVTAISNKTYKLIDILSSPTCISIATFQNIWLKVIY